MTCLTVICVAFLLLLFVGAFAQMLPYLIGALIVIAIIRAVASALVNH